MYPMPMPVPYQQYCNAYPTIHYQQPPGACNGYGWHGNGYGWQLDPKAWHTPPLYPSVNQAVVEEPAIQAEKVEKVNAWCKPSHSCSPCYSPCPRPSYYPCTDPCPPIRKESVRISNMPPGGGGGASAAAAEERRRKGRERRESSASSGNRSKSRIKSEKAGKGKGGKASEGGGRDGAGGAGPDGTGTDGGAYGPNGQYQAGPGGPGGAYGPDGQYQAGPGGVYGGVPGDADAGPGAGYGGAYGPDGQYQPGPGGAYGGSPGGAYNGGLGAGYGGAYGNDLGGPYGGGPGGAFGGGFGPGGGGRWTCTPRTSQMHQICTPNNLESTYTCRTCGNVYKSIQPRLTSFCGTCGSPTLSSPMFSQSPLMVPQQMNPQRLMNFMPPHPDSNLIAYPSGFQPFNNQNIRCRCISANQSNVCTPMRNF